MGPRQYHQTSLILFLFSILTLEFGYSDTVYLSNGLEIDGKILEANDDFVILKVEKDDGDQVGKIKIPVNKIDRDEKGKLRIEYDIFTQLEKLEDDDWEGHYKVGVWAFEKGMYADAERQLLKVQGKPGVGEEFLKILGITQDQLGKEEQALINYQDWLKFHPKDEQIKKRAELLKKKFGSNQENQDPGDTKQVVEGLEATGNWFPENRWEDADPCKILTQAYKNPENKYLAVQFASKKVKIKSAFTRMGKKLTFENKKVLLLKIYHNNKVRTKMSVAFITSKGDFYESRMKEVPANNWAVIEFPLDKGDFKNERTKWKHETDIEDKSSIKRLTFMVYGGEYPETMYIDGIFSK